MKNNNEKSPHILLVDDEDFLVKLWKNILEKHGYKVTGYTEVKLALEDFRNNPHNFDIVVTDQSMPHISGKEFAVELLKIRKNIKIIICSGYLEDREKISELGIGICEFLIKPFDNNALIKAIEKNISNKFYIDNKNNKM